MTPAEFKQARLELGLNVKEMAAMLEVRHEHVLRMEMEPGLSSSRPVVGSLRRLVQAYLDGYRPADWPAPRRKRKAQESKT